MEKWLWITIIILTITLAILPANLYLSEKIIQSSPKEECKILNYTSKGRVNILFFGEKEQAEKYSNFLLDIYPFNQSKEKFNFYYIDTYTPVCELYKDISILCRSKELIKKASVCPSNYIVVLKDEQRSIRSSSYMNILSLNTKHPLSVFPHEFAHAFANLADEYTPAKLPRSQENCKSKCSEFEGLECFSGCSEDNYFRSFENGLMKTLSTKEYGPFDAMLISNKLGNGLDSTITGNVIREPTYCPEQKYYLIEGEYDSGKIKINHQSIENGCPGNNGNGPFQYKLIMEDGLELTNSFNPEIIFTDNEDGGGAEEYSGKFYLRILAIDTAKSIEISVEDIIISKTNLIKEDAVPCQI